MTHTHTHTALGAILIGLSPRAVRVTATPAWRGGIKITGLPEVQAREAMVGLRAAGVASAWDVLIDHLPDGCPASGLDLAIYRAIQGDAQEDTVYLGALDLAGRVLPVRGALCHAEHWPKLVLPSANAWEAGFADRRQGGFIQHVADVHDVGARVARTVFAKPSATSMHMVLTPRQHNLLNAIAGETRALIVAPPGSGKTMIAREAAYRYGRTSGEARRIHSAAGLFANGSCAAPLFRAPHHTVSTAGLVGGGKWPRPGEVSLAHDGVLFLDELPEFRFEAIEMLSAVLKVGSWCGFPAAPRLVLAAANPCPCGYLGATNRTCRCSEKQIATHRARIQRMANLLELTEVSL